jgi:predicted metal-dependent phosphotriesterase family hydrolase
LFRYVIPELKKRGVSQEAIDNMMGENAKRFFKSE